MKKRTSKRSFRLYAALKFSGFISNTWALQEDKDHYVLSPPNRKDSYILINKHKAKYRYFFLFQMDADNIKKIGKNTLPIILEKYAKYL